MTKEKIDNPKVRKPKNITSAKVEEWNIGGKKKKIIVNRSGGKIVDTTKYISQRQADVLIKKSKTSGSVIPTVTRRERLSKGVYQTFSEERVFRKSRTQIVAQMTVLEGSKAFVFYGYSDLGMVGNAGRMKALGRAKRQAREREGFNYDDLNQGFYDVTVVYSYVAYT